MAGLKIFIPKPPKTILPMPMATKDPMHPTYQGAVAGRDSPRISPVTPADKSVTLIGFDLIRVKINSAARQVVTQISNCMAANHLKNQMAAITVGLKAMITSRIITRVVMPILNICGDGATCIAGLDGLMSFFKFSFIF